MIGILIISDIGRRAAGFLSVALLAALPGLAGEDAILTNGFRIHADHHEVAGEMVKLYAGGGVTELPTSQISGFEQDAYVPPPAPPASLPAAPPLAAPSVNVATELRKPLDPKRLAAESAGQNNLLEALILSVMHAESGFQPNALSPKGAIGLMQLMPGTAEQLHADPHDPKQNVEAGATYLRALLTRYEDHDDQVARAVAAYNAGPGAVDRYNGIPPYRETREYVIRVLTEYKKSIQSAGPASREPQPQTATGCVGKCAGGAANAVLAAVSEDER